MTLVLVRWVDSHMEGGWRGSEEAITAAETNGLVCESVGWIVQETSRYLLLAMSRSVDSTGEIADTLQIPVGCIAPGGIKRLTEDSHLRVVGDAA